LSEGTDIHVRIHQRSFNPRSNIRADGMEVIVYVFGD